MKRGIEALSWLSGLIAGIGIMCLILLTTLDVLWRNLMGRSIPGAFEYTEVILVAAVFLSLAWTQRVNAHVSVEIVTNAMPSTIRHLVQAAGLAVAAILLCWMALESGKAAWQSYTSGEFRFGLTRVPIWPARFAVSIGTLLLFLQVGVHCFNEATKALSALHSD